ncbi:MAG: hypothetical protein HRU19_06925 [Pseudobacteriovorax sp.]|nr:hypothetical protein [Pseudobacteriovorax sp.]
MKNFNKLAVLGLTAAFVTGCGDDDDDTPAAGASVFDKSYTVVTGTPTVATDSISGTGTLSFADSLVTARTEKTNFLFTVDLSEGNDSFVALHSFSESDLSGGQIVTLGRTADGSFAVNYTKADGTSGTMTEFNETVDPSAAFTFSIEVHNGEDNGSHVIAWVGDAFPTTAEPGEETDGIFGAGTFTGLNFQNATITAFTVGADEVAEEEDE